MIANMGLPILVLGVVILLMMGLVVGKRKSILDTIVTLKLMRASKSVADANYIQIKALLKDAKPLTRFRFKLLVGAKRYQDYTFTG
jgi:hypothetical protein